MSTLSSAVSQHVQIAIQDHLRDEFAQDSTLNGDFEIALNIQSDNQTITQYLGPQCTDEDPNYVIYSNKGKNKPSVPNNSTNGSSGNQSQGTAPTQLKPNDGLNIKPEAAVVNMVPTDDSNNAVRNNLKIDPDNMLAGDCIPYELAPVDSSKSWRDVMRNLNQQFKKIAKDLDTDGDGKIEKIVISSHGYGDGNGNLLGGYMEVEDSATDGIAIRVEDVADQAARYIEPGGELILNGCGFCADTPEGRRTLKNLQAVAKAYGITIKVTTEASSSASYAKGDFLMITPDGKVHKDNSIAIRENEKANEAEDESIWDAIAAWF